ncbi:DNA polymerase III subunit delta [Clostridiaceae bacterium 35-E11]
MNYKDVLLDLKNDSLEHLYLFYGIESYLIENTIHTIKDKIIDQNFESLNYQVMDGKEVTIDQIINACETLPFMGDKRMIYIKDLECFYSKKKNISESDEERLIKYFDNLPQTTYLFFILTEAVDKRRKIVKAIKKQGKVVEFDKLTEKDVYKWIGKNFGKHHKKIYQKEIAFLLEITGYLDKNSAKNLKDLENEINKLASFVGDKEIIQKEDIAVLAPVSVENNIFSLVEAIGTKNGDKALKLLNDMLLEGEAETKILYMITRQFRYLLQIKLMEAQGYTAMGIAPKLGLQQFVVRKYLKQAMNFSIEGLKKALEECLYSDQSMKSGRIDQRLGIELLISKFAK